MHCASLFIYLSICIFEIIIYYLRSIIIIIIVLLYILFVAVLISYVCDFITRITYVRHTHSNKSWSKDLLIETF